MGRQLAHIRDLFFMLMAPPAVDRLTATTSQRERQRKARLLSFVVCCTCICELPIFIEAIMSEPVGIITATIFEAALISAMLLNRRNQIELATFIFLSGYLIYTTASQFLYSPNSSAAFFWEWTILAIPALLAGLFLPFWAPLIFGLIGACLNTMIYLTWQRFGFYASLLKADDRLDLLTYIYIITIALALIGALFSYSVTKAVTAADRAVELEQAYAQLAAANTQLAELAARDITTGLLNHRSLNECLAREFANAQRTGQPFGVVFGDIDHFKQINDTWGHTIGDLALKHSATILQATVRAIDIVARYGGEEFVMLLPGIDAHNCQTMAERLRATLAAQPLPLADGQVIPITMSLGVAIFPEDGRTVEALLNAADTAMYCAKRAGRNRVCLAADNAKYAAQAA